MTSICFNGKFLSANPTGVHRVAEELILALGTLVENDAQLAKLLNAEILMPKDAKRRLSASPFEHRTIGKLTWQPWEQFELPFYTKRKLLVSLCNLGPISTSNAITMIHDAQVFISPDSYSRAFRTWYQFALPRLGKKNKKILTVSNYSKDQLQKWNIAPAEKIEVIHNGVDHILSTGRDETVLSKLGLKTNGYCVGLSNTQAHKNIKVAIEAFQRPELSDSKLVLFGGAKKEQFEELGVSVPSNVVFAGYVADTELRSLLENAAAMVFPSLTEGFGLPPLEAMLLGTPAICAPCGALPEVCGDMTEYVDANDSAAWASAIQNMMGENQDHRIQAGRSHAEKFTWEAAAQKLADIVVDCL